MNFTLKIDLGNDAMTTRGDVVNALKRSIAVGDADLKTGDGGIVRDDNGNTIGRWEVLDDTSPERDYLVESTRPDGDSHTVIATATSPEHALLIASNDDPSSTHKIVTDEADPFGYKAVADRFGYGKD